MILDALIEEIIDEEAIAFYAIASCLLFIYMIRYIRIYLYTYKGGDEMKVKYTYQTDAARLQILKIIAVQNNIPLNKLIDKIVDAYIKNEQKTFT